MFPVTISKRTYTVRRPESIPVQYVRDTLDIREEKHLTYNRIWRQAKSDALQSSLRMNIYKAVFIIN